MHNLNLDKIKKELEEKRDLIEKELKTFATKDEKLKGDWDTKFLKFNGSSASQEEAADEVEEYITKLPIEHNLELRLRNINLALEKIEKGTYGKCEKCGSPILEERLKAYPEARFCLKCTSR
jgi:DnaK suppressor protein